jgi:hypothetical protein
MINNQTFVIGHTSRRLLIVVGAGNSVLIADN